VVFWLLAKVSEEHTTSIFSTDDEDSMVLQNVGQQPKYHMVPQPRRHPSVLLITEPDYQVCYTEIYIPWQ
jgi:hypothetical protein